MTIDVEAWQAEAGEHRRVEAWPERTDRRVVDLEKRVLHLEKMVHLLVNADALPRRLEAGNQDAMG
jgi:hypothetical protein